MRHTIRLAIVALALSFAACSTLSQILNDEPVTIEAAVQDVGDISAAICALQSPQKQQEIRGVVALLDGMVKAGQVEQVKRLIEQQAAGAAGEQYRALVWLSINRGLGRLSKPEWEEAYSAAIGAAVAGCAEALGVGVA